jgi:hypothetical protein
MHASILLVMDACGTTKRSVDAVMDLALHEGEEFLEILSASLV